MSRLHEMFTCAEFMIYPQDDKKSVQSKVSAFSFKSGSSGGSGGGVGGTVKTGGGFSLKPKMGIGIKSGMGAGGLGSLLKGGQWSTATPVEHGQADDDFEF